MPEEVQQHWRALGWTPSSWHDLADPPPSSDREFSQLSHAELQAARALGYTPKSWDEDTDDPFGTLPATGLQTGMMDKHWSALTVDQREHWRTLGWTEHTWNNDGPAPPSANTDFKDLSPRQQAAALGLGCAPHVGSNPGRAHSLLHLPRGCGGTDTQQSWDEDEGSSSNEYKYGGSGFGKDVKHVRDVVLALVPLAALAWADARWRKGAADALPGGATHLTRQKEQPRADWRHRVRESGLTFAELPGVCWTNRVVSEILLPAVWVRRLGLDEPYWNEGIPIWGSNPRLAEDHRWFCSSHRIRAPCGDRRELPAERRGRVAHRVGRVRAALTAARGGGRGGAQRPASRRVRHPPGALARGARVVGAAPD